MALQSTMNRTQLMYLLMIVVFTSLFVVIFRYLEQNFSFSAKSDEYLSRLRFALNISHLPELATLKSLATTTDNKSGSWNGNNSSVGSEVITLDHSTLGVPRLVESRPVPSLKFKFNETFDLGTRSSHVPAGNTYFPRLFTKVLGARKPPELTTLKSVTATEPPVRQKSKPEKSSDNRSSIGSEVITRKFYLSYRYRGRLGNRMFSYASMLGIAAAQGRKLVVPMGFDLYRIFDLKHKVLYKDTSNWPITTEAPLGPYDKNLLALPAANLIVGGYFQSFKYFQPIRNQIQREFTFLQHINSAADTLMHEYMNSSREYIVVGVHVRRGDFLIEQHRGYAVPDASYFFNAFRWIKKHISGSNIVFLVVSDDLLWCKLNLIAKDVVILPDSPADVHLAVLSKCHHVIMSAGTFGWWGGWLAGGHVIYFSRYLENNTAVGQNFERKDFFLPHWIALDN